MAESDDKFNIKQYYNNIARLFKSGPLVRHRIASKIVAPGEVGTPIGTARAFLRSQSNPYASQLASYGQYSRLARYADYNEMESMAEIGSALDIYADEICSKGEYGEILRVDSQNAEIKKALLILFYDVLNIEFNLWTWVRNLCKYGDQFLLIDHHPDYGVLNCLPLPVNEIEREEGYDKEDPTAHRYRWVTQGNVPLEKWQVVHFRLIGNDGFLPYGSSILEPARRVWRQLILMEDAVMVYRIVRSPERRVFYIDVGNVAPNDVPKFMEQAKARIKNNQVVDTNTGRVDLRYNPLSTDEDYFIPVRGGPDNSSRIETLPGGQFTGDIDDLVYIQNKLFAALKIPKSYLGYEADINGKSTLSQEDVRFGRTVQRMQRVFIAELKKIAILHLFSMGYRDDELLDFDVSMANPSTIAEIQRLELWRTKFEVASLAQEGTFDTTWVYKNIYRLSQEDIEGIQEGKRADALFAKELEDIASGAAEEPPPEAVPPEGEPAPEEPPPEPGEGETPINAGTLKMGRDPNQQRVAPNELIKGKLKMGRVIEKEPNLVNHVYNIKKNALGDPYDLATLRRVGSSPFGESADPDEQLFAKRVGELKKFAEELEEVDVLKNGKSKKVL